MKAILVTFGCVLAAAAQVTVAPLFPAGAAVADAGLIMLMALAFFAGPTTVMFALPFFAVCAGFLTNREPGLLLLGYLPLLPMAAWLESTTVPLTGIGRFLITAAITGISVRLAQTIGAAANGASIPVWTTLSSVFIPGLVFDLCLLTLVYVVCRSIRLEPQRMTLGRGW